MSSASSEEHQTGESELPNPAYLSAYLSHLHDTRLHLIGRDPLCGIPPSYIPPTGYWTSVEKERFFHVLSRYSRLRPDLIAEAIGPSKTVVDVCEYIQLLEDGATKEEALERSDLGCAREVSEEWADFEERQARVIAALEPSWEAQDLIESREDMKKTYHKSLRAPMGSLKVRENGRDWGRERTKKRTFSEWVAEKEGEWAREEWMGRLDEKRLKTLHGLVAENDEREKTAMEVEDGKGKGKGKGKQNGNGNEGGGAREENVGATGAEVQFELPGTDTATLHPSISEPPAIHDSLIDPALLGPSTATTLQVNRHTSHPPHLDPSLLNVPTGDPFAPRPNPAPTPPAPPPDTSASITHPADPDPDPDPSTDDYLRSLSPKSRRRYQNRLYMRRKRAQTAGATEVDVSSRRLKPGPKPKVREDNSSTAPVGEGDVNKDKDKDVKARKSKKGKDKQREETEGLGVDARYVNERIGPLNLMGISKLFGFYADIVSEEERVYAPEGISVRAVELINAHLDIFLRELVAQAISDKEGEIRTKGGLKNFHEISPANVHHALELMGVQVRNKKTFFRELADRFGAEVDVDADGNDDDDEGPQDEGDMGEEAHELDGEDNPGPSSRTGPSPFSLHQDVFTPLVRIPPKYETATDIILDADEEVEELVDELVEEEKVDLEDTREDDRFERALWQEVGIEWKGGARNRRANGREKKVVKSKEFVEDSDVEGE